MVRYCIVGTGFSGTCMLWHLVSTLCQRMNGLRLDPSRIEITTIESRPVNGPGFPYDIDGSAPYHLCNNPAEKMSLFDNDFVDWMLENRDEIIMDFPELILEADRTAQLDQWQPRAEKFYPRALFGIYLLRRFDQACARATHHGITVRNYNGYEAIDGTTREGKFELAIRCLKSGELTRLEHLDKVLLACGHWQSEMPAATILASPYPTRNIYRSISACQQENRRDQLTFYVHGMGPSGVDAILSLCEHGKFRYDANGLANQFEPDWHQFGASEVRIIAGSRSGFFPGVRWPLLDHDFRYLTEFNIENLKNAGGGKIPLDELISLINSELSAASDGRLSFSDVAEPKFGNAYEKLLTDITGSSAEKVLHTVILHARRLRFYEDLNSDDKRRYDQELDTHFIRTAVPIPLQNAKKLVALIESGVLSTIRLGYQKALNASFDLTCSGTTIKPDIVIRSNGHNYDVTRHPSPLIRHMLEGGELVEYNENGYRAGGICAAESTSFRVVNRIRGCPSHSEQLYSFGPITQYWQNQNNYAAAFVNAARMVAQDWVGYAAANVQAEQAG